MHKVRELIKEIESLRKKLQELIDQKDDFLDPEILAVSKMLDVMLNEYHKLLQQKSQDSP